MKKIIDLYLNKTKTINEDAKENVFFGTVIIKLFVPKNLSFDKQQEFAKKQLEEIIKDVPNSRIMDIDLSSDF